MLIGYMRVSTDNAKKTGGLGVEPLLGADATASAPERGGLEQLSLP